MKKTTFLNMTLIIVSSVSILNASPKNEETINQKGMESFFYNKGFADGVTSGERSGYKKAMKHATASLNKYKRKIKALEAGKYLSKRHKITPPRLYQQRGKDGSISVVVKGCAIEKQLSPSEILLLPQTNDYSNTLSRNRPTYSTEQKKIISDNVFLPGIDTRNERPSLAGAEIKVVYKFFPDTGFYRKLFSASGKPYSVISGDKIKVIFKSKREADSFCIRHNLQEGRDVI